MDQPGIFSMDIEVRFRDLDALGHVNNAVYMTYFEEGRKSFSRNFFNVSDPSDFQFIMANVSCNYIKPVKFSDQIKLQMWVENIGTKSFSFGYQLVRSSDTSTIFATGKSVQVCYDYQKAESRAVPDNMKNKLSLYLKK